MTQMRWEQLLSPRRLHDQRSTSTREIGRSPFHKDHDRIVFSGSFRRLGRKTQVHPLTENDHIHTRLTHSLEVGCVGRSLGMIVGELLRDRLPEWITPADLGVIVQTACLGHDIGNPPFGHAGEYAIRDWFQRAQSSGLLEGLSDAEREDLLTYEGNAQGFRVITQIEYNQFNGGMRLSAATLGALLKYPWTVRYGGRAGKFGAYQSEQVLLKEVAEAVGLLPQASSAGAAIHWRGWSRRQMISAMPYWIWKMVWRWASCAMKRLSKYCAKLPESFRPSMPKCKIVMCHSGAALHFCEELRWSGRSMMLARCLCSTSRPC